MKYFSLLTKIGIIIISCFIIPDTIFPQTKTTDSLLLLSTKIEELDSAINKLKKALDVNNHIKFGSFYLKKDIISIYKDTIIHKYKHVQNNNTTKSQSSICTNKTHDCCFIDHVRIYMSGGLIRNIELTCKDKDSTIYHYGKPFSPYKLFYKSKDDTFFIHSLNDKTKKINVKDFLSYKANFKNKYYSPPEDEFILSKKPGKDVKELFYNYDLNTLIDYYIYSDLLGLINKENNGLVQFEFNARVNNNSFCRSARKENHYSNLYYLNYFEANVWISKFDNSNSAVIIDSLPNNNLTYSEINKIDFDRLAFLNISAKVNIASIEYQKFSFDFNAGLAVRMSSLSLPYSDELTTVNPFELFGEFKTVLLEYKNFGFNINARYSIQRLGTSLIDEEDEYEPFFSGNMTLFYYPKENKKNKIFFRFRRKWDMQHPNQYYTMVQIGYSAPLKH